VSVWQRLAAVVRRRRLDTELDEELSAHIELAVDDYVRSGMKPDEARRAAMAALGGMAAAREIHREARGIPFMETIWQDIKYSIRTLRRDAGLAVFAVLIAGLGVGATATVFSVVHAILLRGLPVADSDRLAFIANNNGPGLSSRTIQVGYLQELQAHAQSFSEIGGYFSFYGIGDWKMTGTGEPERLTGVPVTGNFFRVLGVDVQMGRQFTDAETKIGGPRAVILTHPFWERRMNADPNIVGKALTLNNESVTVAGVLPAAFDFAALFVPGQKIDVFIPFPLAPETHRQGNTMSLVGRLKPGVTAAAAHSELLIQAKRISGEHGDWNRFNPKVTDLREYISGGFRPAMMLLSGAVGLVLLIVCANLSNLLLARAASRQKEIAIRSALGAGRGRLIRQMLVESLLLSSAGAVLGVALAFGGTRLLANLNTSVALLTQVRLDWTVAGFALGIAMLTGVGFGLMPALRVSGLRSSDRGSSSGRDHARLRGALVMVEVALACLLLAGSGLLVRSFLRVMDVDLGFRPEQAVAVRIDPGRRFANTEERIAYFQDALRRIGTAPGVEKAGLSDSLPLGRNRTWGAAAKGVVYTEKTYPFAYVRIVSHGYFGSMGIPIRKGRDFAAGDGATGKQVIIINESMAKSLWPGEDPIGKIMRTDQPDREVIGVVQDLRHLALEQASGSEMYLPMWQTRDYSTVDLVVRGSGRQKDIEAAVRTELRAIDPTLPLTTFRTIQGIVDQSVSPRRLLAILLTGFAVFAVILASLGIYGVISYSVTQRRKEMGIRMALGATAGTLRGQVVGQTLRLTLGGLAVGLGASWILLRSLQGMLYGVTASDPVTFGGALLVLTSVALLAGYLPARRAAALNPVEALRTE